MHLQPHRPLPDVPAPSADLVPPRAPERALAAESELEETFCAAYLRVHDRALDFAERFLDRMDAEDAIGNATLKAWNNWPTLAPGQRTFAYFLRAVRTSVVDMLRASKRYVSLEDAEDELVAPSVWKALPTTRGMSADEVLDFAIAAMPPKRREVMVLLRDQRLTYKEVGDVLRISENTVAGHYSAAIDDLRAAYQQAGFHVANSDPARLQAPREVDPPSRTGGDADA